MVEAGLAESEAKSKVRLKFRVSAFAGDGAAKSSEAKWTEKWGVGLLEYEEFHVTDQLLKLPFQENPPKTVCIFSLADGGLRFRLTDSDRKSQVNSVEKDEAIVYSGDKVLIGGTLQIEILQAPEAAAKPEPVLDASEAVTKKAGSVLERNSLATDAPTVQTSTTETPKKEEDGPTLTFISKEQAESQEGIPGPIFKQAENAVEIDEPTTGRIRQQKRNPRTPDQALQDLFDDSPVELVKPRDHKRDRSLEEDGPSFDPVYAKYADLDPNRLSIAERIFAAIAKMLRRDDIGPAPEKFPLDDFSPAVPQKTFETKPKALKTNSAPNPWLPEQKIELDLRSLERSQRGARSPGGSTGGRPDVVAPWIPEAESSGARMRGRALVFVLSAGITLVVAGSAYLYFEHWMGHRATEEGIQDLGEIRQDSFDKGIPVEFIQEKVWRMKRR